MGHKNIADARAYNRANKDRINANARARRAARNAEMGHIRRDNGGCKRQDKHADKDGSLHEVMKLWLTN